MKKETLAQVFSCEFCEISKNTVFTEHLWTTASRSRFNLLGVFYYIGKQRLQQRKKMTFRKCLRGRKK